MPICGMLKKKNEPKKIKKLVSKKVNSQIKYQHEVESILIENGFEKKLIKFDYKFDGKKHRVEIADVVVLDKKTGLPEIVINVQMNEFYKNLMYSYEDTDDTFLQLSDENRIHEINYLEKIKDSHQDKHVISYNGKEFTIIDRLQFPLHNLDFIVNLKNNEINELKKNTPKELMETHRIKHNLVTPIENKYFASSGFRAHILHEVGKSEFFRMLMIKYFDETDNSNKLLNRTNDINEQLFHEFKQDNPNVQKFEEENHLDLKTCLKYFETFVGRQLRYFTISNSNPFELIKLISQYMDDKTGDVQITPEIMNFVSEIQDIEKNSTILLDNLSFNAVFDHIFIILEKLNCQIHNHQNFVNLFIINKNIEELKKIKFIFQVLGIKTDNVKVDFSQLNIKNKINYHIALKPFNQKSRENYDNIEDVKKLQFGTQDQSKYEIIDFIDNVQTGTTMSFIVAPNMLFSESKGSKLFRQELLKKTKILAIIELPSGSLTSTSIKSNLIILQKIKNENLDYDIFMSHIDKMDVDFLFTEKSIIKKYNEFKNSNKLKNQTDFGFLVNTSQLKENWSVNQRIPSKLKRLSALKILNPIALAKVAEIIRPIKYSKLESIIKIADMDGFLEVLMSGTKKKSENISEDVPIISIFEPGDILFSITGNIGKTAKITSKIPNMGLSRGIVIIRPDQSKITSDYLKHVLDSNNTHLQITPSGNAIKFMPISLLHGIRIEYTPIKEQKEIVEKILSLEIKILELKTMIQKYESDIKRIIQKQS